MLITCVRMSVVCRDRRGVSVPQSLVKRTSVRPHCCTPSRTAPRQPPPSPPPTRPSDLPLHAEWMCGLCDRVRSDVPVISPSLSLTPTPTPPRRFPLCVGRDARAACMFRCHVRHDPCTPRCTFAALIHMVRYAGCMKRVVTSDLGTPHTASHPPSPPHTCTHPPTPPALSAHTWRVCCDLGCHSRTVISRQQPMVEPPPPFITTITPTLIRPHHTCANQTVTDPAKPPLLRSPTSTDTAIQTYPCDHASEPSTRAFFNRAGTV